MRSGLTIVGPPPSLPVLPIPMQPQPSPLMGIPSSLPPPPPPAAPGYRKRKPNDGSDLSLNGMNQAAGARARQKINITHEELEARKKLSNIRVVQKNLVYVTNISLDFLNKGSASLDIAPGEFLSRHEYFGQYGEIFKLVVNLNAIYNANSSHGPSVSCYVTYRRNDDATACITAVNGAWLGGKLLRASNGTTKYCTYFLRGLTCSNAECLYLHELGHDKDSFTKESMAADKNLFSESVHPKISFTERGENVLPPVYSNFKLDMSTLVIYERAASLFPPKYTDVIARPSNYIIVTSPLKIVTVFLSPASGSGSIISSVLCPTPSGIPGITQQQSALAGTVNTPTIISSSSTIISPTAMAPTQINSGTLMSASAIPQDVSSPSIPSTSPQHQQYFSIHTPGSDVSSPQKAFNSHSAAASVNGLISSPFSSYDGRLAVLITEDSDEFPPLNPAADIVPKSAKKDRKRGEFWAQNDNNGNINDNEDAYDDLLDAGNDNGSNIYYGGYGNEPVLNERTEEEERELREEEERKRKMRRIRNRKLLNFDIDTLSDEERALSSVIRELGDEFDDEVVLASRIHNADNEFGGNPLLCPLPPLDDMPFINSDRDAALSGNVSASLYDNYSMLSREMLPDFYQDSLFTDEMLCQNPLPDDENVCGTTCDTNDNDGVKKDFVDGFADVTNPLSTDISNEVVSDTNSFEENSWEEGDENEEEDDEEDDDDEQENDSPHILPRCSCCGGLILSSARNKRRSSNDTETDGETSTKDGDDDDDDDDVPPELVNPSNSEDDDDDDDDDDDGENSCEDESNDADGSENDKSSGVLPSILDGDGSVSASDHVAIHIPNSSILICPLYSRSTNKKNN